MDIPGALKYAFPMFLEGQVLGESRLVATTALCSSLMGPGMGLSSGGVSFIRLLPGPATDKIV